MRQKSNARKNSSIKWKNISVYIFTNSDIKFFTLTEFKFSTSPTNRLILSSKLTCKGEGIRPKSIPSYESCLTNTLASSYFFSPHGTKNQKKKKQITKQKQKVSVQCPVKVTSIRIGERLPPSGPSFLFPSPSLLFFSPNWPDIHAKIILVKEFEPSKLSRRNITKCKSMQQN